MCWIFCAVTLCRPEEIHRRFAVAYSLDLQGRRVRQESSEKEASVPPNRWQTCARLHGVTSQSIILFAYM
jgi:hypothetical protein